MASMEEEKRCPLCAEEMDWTDQQFKPCKCGYQVCVWCWHHIIDMAEKDKSEGRCPACRTLYEKEKIVAMQANFGRTVTKNTSRKTKPPKAKAKTAEVKKDLTNVRVIQRKMVYVIGLPLTLADEDLLQRKEYFGQYGKVDKVSLSRTAGGTIQQFIHETCSVYITYSKDEEAVRCIQLVHGFTLEGRFLRASFGTAKYCHAWLNNMPCNNPACLYLHSIGADEDSFGKDEVAAVHTRGRVQQIVGATNNVVKRFGNSLPPPDDDIYNSTSAFNDKFNARNSVADAVHGSINSNNDFTCPKEKERGIAGPHKITTFVDIVGRSNNSCPEKDGNILEESLITNLPSALSSSTMGENIYPGQPHSVPTLSNRSSKRILDEQFIREDSYLFENQESKDRACLVQPSYPKNHSLNDLSVDHKNNVHNRVDEEPSLRVNSVLNDALQESKFQNSTKSDRIYRSSNSFSNEEIVEHLRRIDDDKSTNDSGLETVENSIISSIMSLDFESSGDSFPKHNGVSKLVDENHGLYGSSWNSLNNDQSGYSYFNQNVFGNQVAGSFLPDYRDNIKEQYLRKPQYPATPAQYLATPKLSIPSRDPPPGFSTRERTVCLPRSSSGNSLLQLSSTRFSNSTNDVDFIDSAILNCIRDKPMNGIQTPGFETRPASSSSQLSAFEDDARLWLLMQQQQSAASTNQDSNFNQIFIPQTPSVQQQEPPSYYRGHIGNGSFVDDIYGFSSRLADQQNNYDPSFFTQQRYANVNISNTNGSYRPRFDEVRHNSEVGMQKLGEFGL